MTEWNNKTFIITGGGSGIGKSTAAIFLKKGATVYINGRTEAIYFLSKPEVEAITGVCLPVDFGLTAGY